MESSSSSPRPSRSYGRSPMQILRDTSSAGQTATARILGYFHAPRGNRLHDGVDYVCTANQSLKAAMSGIVTRRTLAYTDGMDCLTLEGIEIVASDGTKCLMLYLRPMAGIIGKIIRAGHDVVGSALTLQRRYPKDATHPTAITDHIHVRIHTRSDVAMDPATLIRRVSESCENSA